MLAKLLGSAIANATENEKADVDKLVVTQGLRRRAARCMKRFDAARDGPREPHHKKTRTSHVTVVVDTRGIRTRLAHGTERHIQSVSVSASFAAGSSKWYAEKDYAKWLHEDLRLEKFVKQKLNHAGVAAVEIERAANKVKINIFTARPGIVIGKRGAGVETLKKEVQALTKNEVFLNITRSARPRPTRSSSPRTSRRSSSAASPSAAR